jgi:N-acyl-D-amino-acid deacylase
MQHEFDLLLVGGEVYDGLGAPREAANIGVTGDRVVYVGTERPPAARCVAIDGLVVSPGFIDMHVHSDLAVLTDPVRESQVRQGVTTEVVGQDGFAYAPVIETMAEDLVVAMTPWNGRLPDELWHLSVAQYLALADVRSRLNVACLAPHGNLRMIAMGVSPEEASPDATAIMTSELRQAMSEGAFGLSAGLTYAPSMYATNEELIALCHVVAEFQGIYVPHHRNYGSDAMSSYAECIDVARASGVALHLTHAHLGFPANRGRAGDLLSMIDCACDSGQVISLDSYPYGPAATSLIAILPEWVLQKSIHDKLAILRDPEAMERIAREMSDVGTLGHMGEPVDWSRIIVAATEAPRFATYAGRSMSHIANETDSSVGQVLAEILIEDDLNTLVIVDIGNPENVETILASPRHCVGSDGMHVGERPHPRGFGSHARLIGHYVNERHSLTMPEAIRHMTSAPAAVLGLSDRGVLKAGFKADLAVFDEAEFADNATFDSPRRTATGMHSVLINGHWVMEGGVLIDGAPGQGLRHKGRGIGGGGA